MTKKPYFIWVIGHNASGKTTLSKQLSDDLKIDRVNGDDIRRLLVNNYIYFNNLDVSRPYDERYDSLNDIVDSFRFSVIQNLILNHRDVIMDGSGSKRARRNTMFRFLDDNIGANLYRSIFIHVKIEEELLLTRLEERDTQNKSTQWKYKYINKTKDSFEEPKQDEANYYLEYNQINYQDLLEHLKRIIK